MRDPDPDETMATLSIAAKFEDSGELLNWTVPRVNRLCRMWHATPAELFHNLGELDFKKIRRYMASKAKFPFPSTVCKQLSEMEADIIARGLGAEAMKKGKVAA